MLEANQVNFQTNLRLEDIVQFYRREYNARGLSEIALMTVISAECISLAFAGLPDDKKVIVQAVDLGYGDMRNINLRSEGGGRSPEELPRPPATVKSGVIDIVLGMTGLALEKAGYSNAADVVKENFFAECTVCGVKISGANILSEQRQLFRQWGKEAVVLYRGPGALAWENLDENKCVKPGCNSTTYRLSWTDSETRHIFDSVRSRFEKNICLTAEMRRSQKESSFDPTGGRQSGSGPKGERKIKSCWAYDFGWYRSVEGMLSVLNSAGLWQWELRESSWYGDYLNARPAEGVRVRIHEYPQTGEAGEFVGLRDKGFSALLEIEAESSATREKIDEAFRGLLGKIGVEDVKEIEPYD